VLNFVATFRQAPIATPDGPLHLRVLADRAAEIPGMLSPCATTT
jgi:hypothetical protein